MPVEDVVVMVAGSPFRSWKKITVRGSMKEAARQFSLTIAAENGASAVARQFQAFAPVQILGNGALILDGYVTRRQPVLSATDAHIVIAGHSKGKDAVDSSAMHKTGRFENKTVLEIGKEIIGQTGIDVALSADVDLPKIPEWQITPGETVFRALERLARDSGHTLQGEASGIKITNASKGPKRHGGGIVEGVNLKEGSADHNAENRHSKVHARGQKYDGHGPGSLELEGVATDKTVPRNRPLVLVPNGDTDAKRVKQRAGHHRDRAAGHGLRAHVSLVGWRDSGGALWTPGWKVWVESPYLDVVQDMLVESFEFSQDEHGSGTIAALDLCDPRAYRGKKGGRVKSGKQWNQDESEAV